MVSCLWQCLIPSPRGVPLCGGSAVEVPPCGSSSSHTVNLGINRSIFAQLRTSQCSVHFPAAAFHGMSSSQAQFLPSAAPGWSPGLLSSEQFRTQHESNKKTSLYYFFVWINNPNNPNIFSSCFSSSRAVFYLLPVCNAVWFSWRQGHFSVTNVC